MTWNIVSLVLASATGWEALAFGALPVSVLREHSRAPLGLAAAWIIVAVLASPAIFHWYLIFAILCLVALTKITRTGGKVFLAVAAGLGLSLGIVFPLETSPSLLLRENPYTLGLLYLGGAMAGFSHVICITSTGRTATPWRPRGLARGFLLVVVLWMAALAARPWLSQHSTLVHPIETWLPPKNFHALMAALFGGAFVLLFLALLVVVEVRRHALNRARLLAGMATALAIIEGLLAQFFYV